MPLVLLVLVRYPPKLLTPQGHVHPCNNLTLSGYPIQPPSARMESSTGLTIPTDQDAGPGEEFSNRERWALIQQLQLKLGQLVPIETWACLWLSDINKLKDFLNDFSTLSVQSLFKPGNISDEVVKPCPSLFSPTRLSY